jgi:hypothetical protein
MSFWPPGRKRLRIQTESLGRAWDQVLNHDVCRVDHRVEEPSIFIVLDVELD